MIGALTRWRLVIALGAATCALWAWLAFDRPRGDEPSAREEALVPGFDASAVKALDLSRAGVTTHLERRDDGWWLDGKRGRAESAVVESMLAAVEFARVDRRPTLSRIAAGLDPPRATLHAAGFTVAVGAEDALGVAVFANRLGDDRIAVTDRRLASALDIPAEELRAGALVEGVAGAKSVAIGEVCLARRGAGWVLGGGGSVVRADPDSAEALVRSLGEARASRFSDGDAPANLAVTVDGVVRARLGGPCKDHPEERFARRADGAGLCLSVAAARALTVAAASFVTTSPTPVVVDRVHTLTLAAAGRVLVVERGGAGWRILAPTPGPADELATEGLVASLASVRGRPVARGERFTPQQGGAHGELIADDGDRLTFTVIGRAGAEIIVRRDAEPGLLALPPTFAALIDPDPARIAAANQSPDGGAAKPLD